MNTYEMMNYLTPTTLAGIAKDTQEQIDDALGSERELTAIQMAAYRALAENVGSAEAAQMTGPCAATTIYVEHGDFIEYEELHPTDDPARPETVTVMAMVIKTIWHEANQVSLKLAYDEDDEEGSWMQFEFFEYNVL